MTADAVPFRIGIDHDACIGSGTCVASAPLVFRLNDAGQAEVIAFELATIELAREAAADCPSEAISVTT
jgi:ferredoxin